LSKPQGFRPTDIRIRKVRYMAERAHSEAVGYKIQHHISPKPHLARGRFFNLRSNLHTYTILRIRNPFLTQSEFITFSKFLPFRALSMSTSARTYRFSPNRSNFQYSLTLRLFFQNGFVLSFLWGRQKPVLISRKAARWVDCRKVLGVIVGLWLIYSITKNHFTPF